MNFCHLCAFYGECMKLVTTSDSWDNAFPAVMGLGVSGRAAVEISDHLIWVTWLFFFVFQKF